MMITPFLVWLSVVWPILVWTSYRCFVKCQLEEPTTLHTRFRDLGEANFLVLDHDNWPAQKLYCHPSFTKAVSNLLVLAVSKQVNAAPYLRGVRYCAQFLLSVSSLPLSVKVRSCHACVNLSRLRSELLSRRRLLTARVGHETIRTRIYTRSFT